MTHIRALETRSVGWGCLRGIHGEGRDGARGLRPPVASTQKGLSHRSQPTRGLDRRLLLGQASASGGLELESWICHELAA